MANEGICVFNKFGYCKYSDKCRKRHINETCANKTCEVDKCLKRHPKSCWYYQEYERCKFGEYCNYKHIKKESNSQILKDLENVKEKLIIIKKTLEKKDEEIESIKENLKLLNHGVKYSSLETVKIFFLHPTRTRL